jgi:hypothetical protein
MTISDRTGQVWRLVDIVFLVLSSASRQGPDSRQTWHRCLLLDDAVKPNNVGRLDLFVETSGTSWDDNTGGPSWKRLV